MTTETDPLATAIDDAVIAMNNAAALIETLAAKPTGVPEALADTLNGASSILNNAIAAATIEPPTGATVDGEQVGAAELPRDPTSPEVSSGLTIA